ncbi:MAG: ECF transporter S component [Clostridiales bacterium]|nr:ECF transporter S component [Clostridiales bacterium]
MSKSLSEKRTAKLRELILASVFCALIIVMTVVPYLGYISYGAIEITTLHIVTILAAVCLGPKYGSVVGLVWGLSCIVRAYVAFPVFLQSGFGNFFVAGLPRLLVGLFAGLVFYGLKKTKLPTAVSAGAAAVVGTLTNTVFVLSAMNLWLKFNDKGYSSFFDVFNTIFKTLITVNGLIELVAAVIIVPTVYAAIEKNNKKTSV